MLEWALKYRQMGLSVIPLKPGDKTPLMAWAEFQKRRASDEEIRAWWVAAPNANIGILTGTISGVVVVDLDGPVGLTNGQKLGLTSTVISLTGDGRQLFYKWSDGICNSVSQIAEGIDVRGEGGYVVAPPSVHPNGRRYRWLKPLDARSVNFLTPPPSVCHSPATVTGRTGGKDVDWISKALEGLKHGNRDNTIFSVLSRLRRDGYSLLDSRAFMYPYAREVDAVEILDAKIKNVWQKYEPAMRTNSSLSLHWPGNSDSWTRYQQLQRGVGDSGDETIKTGYPRLDNMLSGGLKSSRLFTVAARTGVGKTNWIIGVCRNLCEAGRKVLLFSTEMPYGEIWDRYIQTLKDPTLFAGHEFYVCDSFAPNIERIEEAINEIKPDLFIFDHINHVAEDPRELGTFMQGLNLLRRKYECAGIVSAQLNRAADWVDLKTGEKVTPRMSMIKGSGTIEQASSRVLLLSEVRVTPECTEIVGNLDKNDNGERGIVHFGLFKSPWRIEELP